MQMDSAALTELLPSLYEKAWCHEIVNTIQIKVTEKDRLVCEFQTNLSHINTQGTVHGALFIFVRTLFINKSHFNLVNRCLLDHIGIIIKRKYDRWF